MLSGMLTICNPKHPNMFYRLQQKIFSSCVSRSVTGQELAGSALIPSLSQGYLDCWQLVAVPE